MVCPARISDSWPSSLQSRNRSIETVNIVTSNFEADQGMAGGAAVNVQVKSGTNSLRGSAFEYFEHAKLRARNYFLPAASEKPKGTKNIYGGTIGGPIKPNTLFYFFSLETTDSRAVGGPFIGSSALLLSLPPTEFRTGNFSSTGVAIYDPLTGNPNGTGRTPFAFANCPGVTSLTDSRFAACNYIPASRLSPVAQRLLAYLPAPQTAGNVNNYVSAPPFTSLFYKIDPKVTWTPTSRLNLNARISGLHDDLNSAGLYAPWTKPLSLGTDLNAKIFSYSLAATMTLTPNLVMDVLEVRQRRTPISNPMGRNSAGRISSAFRMPARPGTGRCPKWRSRGLQPEAAPQAARSRSATTASAHRCSTITMVSTRSWQTLAGPGATTT